MDRFTRNRISNDQKNTIEKLKMKKSGLAIFDVEGVLIPKKRYLFFQVGKTLGFSQFVRIIFFGFLYELGLISLKSALKQVFKAFKGLKIADLVQIFRQVPLMISIEETFEKLRDENWKTALISSGLPTIIVKELASLLKADYSFGFEVETKDGVLTGEIGGDVIERRGKLPVLKRILKMEGLVPKDCIVIADDRNNTAIFLPEILKIGYNPDFVIRMKADVVVMGKLLEILPLTREEEKQQRVLPSINNIIRKTIHAGGFMVPVLSSVLGLYTVVTLILVISILYVISELARLERKNLPIITSITRYAATQTELLGFATAPLFFALGILLTLLFFPPQASSAAIAIGVIGDSTASIFGSILGKTRLPLNTGKTLEGSSIGFFFAFSAGMFFVPPLKALIGAATAMIVEYFPLPVNDDLIMPLFTGGVLALTA